MLERSIRTFALDYYRNRGAKIRPIEGTAAYEILPLSGTALTVTFAPEPEQPSWVSLTPTSPHWRQILEDLTTDVVVSYRYLVAGPIPDAVAALTPVMPEGWQVGSARLVKVESRQAVGVTHRVTFDSNALNASQETMHHHLWDVETGERLYELENRMFRLPTVLLRPTQTPEEALVDRMLAASLEQVDVESTAQGLEIERELAELLSEAEKRTNQYFDQQMGNVMAREAQLSEKLDTTIRRLAEAKTPEQVARYRADGEQIAAQIEYLKARRGDELAAIESACLAKLATEREKHELTVTTDLVALAHVTYDVVTYAVTAIAPGGLEAAWDVRYTPVTETLALPGCDGCGTAMIAPVHVGEGRCACAGCVTSCAHCETQHVAAHFVASDCATCHQALCVGCETRCAHCQTAVCADHVGECATCEAPVCAGCARACKVCEMALCLHHAQRDPLNGLDYCDRHALRAEPLPEALAPVAATPVLVPAEAPVAAPAPAVRLPLDPRDEVCHHCDTAFRSTELVNCGTCGVPSCAPCTQGPAAPCPACTALAPVDADHARLGFVFESFPQFAKGRRQWEVAEHGPYVLAHWRRLGKGGLVVYHNGGPEPVMLTEFTYGPLDAARMAVIGWLGGR